MTLVKEDFDFILTEDSLNGELYYLNIDIGYHNVVFVFPLLELGTRLKCTKRSFHSFEYLAELEKEAISDIGTQRTFVNVFNRSRNSKMRIFKMLVDSKNIVYIYFEMNDR